MPNKSEHLKKNLIEALIKSMGVVQQACKSVGVSRTTFYDYYNNDEKFKAAVDDCKEIALDFAESKLLKNIDGGKETSIIFYLKTQGKKRGYIERTEVEATIKGNVHIEPKEFIDDSDTQEV